MRRALVVFALLALAAPASAFAHASVRATGPSYGERLEQPPRTAWVRFDQAVKALESLLKTHPESKESEAARLRIGSILLSRLNAPEAAAKRLEEFLKRHPQSELRGFAEGLLKTARARVA